MKTLILILTAAVTIVANQAFSQTISATGTSGTITPGGAFTSTISLSITGTNTIGNVESLNMLLGTPSTGANSGVGLFTVYVSGENSPFSLANSSSSSSNQSNFNTSGDAANSGNNVSTASLDLGANAPPGSAPTVASSGTTTFNVDMLTFTASPSIAPGVYDFFLTSGGHTDSQGSWIDNTSNATFDVNSTPVFTITVIPEPATWSLFGLGAIGAFGLTLLRARKA